MALKYDSLDKVRVRLNELVADTAIKKMCQDYINHTPDFNQTIAFAQKVADISFKGIVVDGKLIEGKSFFKKTEIVDCITEFYQYLDSLSPSGNDLSEIVVDNLQYMTIATRGNFRSCCGRDDKDKWIKIKMDKRLSDSGTAIHEVCHSLSNNFIYDNYRKKDWLMIELCPVITDALSKLFLSEKFPQYKENFAMLQRADNIQNVMKARQSVIEGEFIKFILGKQTLQGAFNIYKYYFGDNLKIIDEILKNIDKMQKPNSKYKVMPLYEARYIIPQAVAMLIAKKFKENPQAVAKQFKEVLEVDCDITLDEALVMLDLPDKDQVLDDYVNNFASYCDNFADDEAENS